MICSLSSSSDGNCYYVKLNGHEFLIDIGISCRQCVKFLRELGTKPQNIEAIFITHEHGDHIKGAKNFCKTYKPPLHILNSCYTASPNSFFTETVITHSPIYEINLGNVLISSFVTSHDSCGSVGYLFETDKIKYGIATDLGYISGSVKKSLTACDLVILESNYDEKMLCFNPNYSPQLKERIMSNQGHLSNSDANDFCCYLSETGTKTIMLAHLSEENNTPILAKSCVEKKLLDANLSAKILVAAKDKISIGEENEEELYL